MWAGSGSFPELILTRNRNSKDEANDESYGEVIFAGSGLSVRWARRQRLHIMSTSAVIASWLERSKS